MRASGPDRFEQRPFRSEHLIAAERDARNVVEVDIVPNLAPFGAVHVDENGVRVVAYARGDAPLRLEVGLEQGEHRAQVTFLVRAHAGEAQDQGKGLIVGIHASSRRFRRAPDCPARAAAPPSPRRWCRRRREPHG